MRRKSPEQDVHRRKYTKHGMSRSLLWAVWHAMQQRCTNQNLKAFPNYGGRGIQICADWNDFGTFKEWALSAGYQQGLSLERINNDGPYAPGNCRWASMLEQAQNTRRTRLVTVAGKTQSVRQWAREMGLAPSTPYYRVKVGWPIELAVSTPPHMERPV